MELNVLTFIEKGGFLAIGAFLVYQMKQFNDAIKGKASQKEQDKLSKKVDEMDETLSAKVYSLETEYVLKADFYRDVSGWRGDIQRLFDKVDTLTKELAYFRGAYDGCNNREHTYGK